MGDVGLNSEPHLPAVELLGVEKCSADMLRSEHFWKDPFDTLVEDRMFFHMGVFQVETNWFHLTRLWRTFCL